MIFLGTNCAHQIPQTQLAPPPADAKFTGKVLAGILTIEPAFDQKGNYLVISPALGQYYFYLQLTAKELELEILRLRALLEKK